jgi:hypothetical protein
VARNHDNFAQRDFSGVTGQVGYHWSPSARLQIGLAATRDINSFQDSTAVYTSSYYVANGLSLTPVWTISPKLAVHGKCDLSERTFRGEIAPALTRRMDKQRSLALGLDWMPTRTLTLSGSLQRDHRGSTISGFDYDDTSAGVTAQLLF